MTAAGSGRWTEAGRSDGSAAATEVALNWLQRDQLSPGSAWYAAWGLQHEQFLFGAGRALPFRRLEDVAVPLAVEYYVHGEEAASLTLRPGWYFANHPGSSSFDVPIEAVSGIPLAGASGAAWSGSTRPASITGRSRSSSCIPWDIAPGVRLDAVFPEPSLEVTLGPRIKAAISGVLAGGGFQTTTGSRRTPVEYTSYRLKATLRDQVWPWLAVTGGGGYEWAREFDFFRASRRIDGSGAPFFHLDLEFIPGSK